MKNEIIRMEEKHMIVMDIKINNFMALNNFHLNMSYPKRIVGSYIKGEYLKERPNFRYKKVNILMGANATGKTSIGRMLMEIFNFMDKKQYNALAQVITDKDKEASFTIDFVGNQFILYRVHTVIKPPMEREYTSSDIYVRVMSVNINSRDSYETCVQRLEETPETGEENYLQELEKVDGLSWIFQYPFDYGEDKKQNYVARDSRIYTRVLQNILKTLDSSIIKVEMSNEVKNTYIIRYPHDSVIVKDGKVSGLDVLSSGTKAGIAIAGLLTAIIEDSCGFYYCDEKFSYIHSDIEKAILSLMIQRLNDNDQLFFTTHNMDILELPLPKHSFTFLKKDIYDEEQPIKCVSASAFLKRSTDSVKSAVENDLFDTAPSVDLLYELAEI